MSGSATQTPHLGSSAPSPTSRPGIVGHALLVGLPAQFAQSIAYEARALGYSFSIAENVDVPSDFARFGPLLIIVNLDMPAGVDVVSELRGHFPEAEIVPITNVLCVNAIAEAVRHGASTVLSRPTNFAQIQAALTRTSVPKPSTDHMSYDRAVWEYLNQVVLEAGSIAGAARRLRLDRTSLKRKLRKVPLR